MKEKIHEKLEELSEYVSILKDYTSHNSKEVENDKTLKGALERYLHLSLEIIIEISEMIISREGYRKPENYREVIEILGEESILPEEFAQRFAPAAGMRNILVHRYGDVDIKIIMRNLKENLEDFNTFSKKVAKYAEELD